MHYNANKNHANIKYVALPTTIAIIIIAYYAKRQPDIYK